MKYRYTIDPDSKAEYLQINASPVIKTVELREGLNLDLDKEGNVIGIEILKN